MGRGLSFNLKEVKDVSSGPLEVLNAFSGARSVSDKDSGYHPEVPQEGGGHSSTGGGGERQGSTTQGASLHSGHNGHPS